jgi:hypothetical protein
MKQIIFTVIVVSCVTASGLAVPAANAAERADRPQAIDMKKQHQTMKTIGAQWTKAKQALAKGEFQAAEPAIRKLIDVAPNVERFQLHRSPEKRDQFLEYYKSFVVSLDQLRNAAASNDRALSGDIIKAVDRTCTQCHAVFGGGHHHAR